MAALQSKGHIELDGYLFMIARQPRGDKHIYGREEAPAFVNKFSSGDPNYRDSTFYPHWVQNNWLNGFDQEKFNDGAKFYRSSGIDITNQEKLKLQKRFFSAGQVAGGVTIRTQNSWRVFASSPFGDGSDGVVTISTNQTYDENSTPKLIFATCTGSSGSTTLSATNTDFASGQHILIIQMQGANAGSYLKTKILAYSAGTITTQDPLNIAYVTGAQVLVLKQFSNVTVNTSITWSVKAWNGTTGGVLAFLSNGTVTITGTISGAGLGFRGGDREASGTPPAYAEQGESSTGVGSRTTSANGAGGGGAGDEGSGEGSSGGGGGHATAGGAGAGAVPGAAGGTIGVANLSTMFMGAGGGGGVGPGGNDTGGLGGDGGAIVYIFGKTISVTGAISVNGEDGNIDGSPGGSNGSGGGGGAAGSIMIRCQTATLGTNLLTALGGAGGAGNTGSPNGGAGGNGRIHIDYYTSFSGTTNPTIDSAQDGTLVDVPTSSSPTMYVGASNGKIYTWDGASTFTRVFDVRMLRWFDTVANKDTDYFIGDQAAIERAQAQSFQLATTTKIKGVEFYIKTANGTPANLQVRIETNNAGVPSGTLVNAALDVTIAQATIPGTYGFITAEFGSAIELVGGTTYWLVLKTAAAANDQNYNVGADASSPGFTQGNMAHSADGGATWTADTAADMLFRILGEAAQVNCSLVTTVGGTQKLYFGAGDPSNNNNSNARLYAYDGSDWALTKTFNTTNESVVLSLAEYGITTSKVYIGLGSKAKIYSTTDFTTFTLSKTITIPDQPGYVFDLIEYNQRLYACGGYPEQLYGNNTQYSGFLYSFDEFTWNNVGEFQHTVPISLDTYDNLLFIGTIKKSFYVYNTASIDKLLEFPWDVQISDMRKWDDKLAISLAPTPGTAISGNEGVYLFDRNGFHNAFAVTSRSWYALFVFQNNLMAGNDDGFIYQTSNTTYQASGTLQTSYFEASLPSIDKLWRSLILHMEALPSGTSILCEYKTDEADASWTNIGTANTLNEKLKEFTFANPVLSKKISIRFTFATTNSANTPTLKIMDIRYVLAPDFKYLWKMKLACADNLIWLDGTEPITTNTATISAGATSMTVGSTAGFPTKGRGVIIDAGVEDEFTWTGKTATTLTGIPATGADALGAHTSTGLTVKMTGRTLHKTILTLKQTKQFFTYKDIDEITYTVLFHSFQADDFVVNQTDGIENNVPITLLEA